MVKALKQKRILSIGGGSAEKSGAIINKKIVIKGPKDEDGKDLPDFGEVHFLFTHEHRKAFADDYLNIFVRRGFIANPEKANPLVMYYVQEGYDLEAARVAAMSHMENRMMGLANGRASTLQTMLIMSMLISKVFKLNPYWKTKHFFMDPTDDGWEPPINISDDYEYGISTEELLSKVFFADNTKAEEAALESGMPFVDMRPNVKSIVDWKIYLTMGLMAALPDLQEKIYSMLPEIINAISLNPDELDPNLSQ